MALLDANLTGPGDCLICGHRNCACRGDGPSAYRFDDPLLPLEVIRERRMSLVGSDQIQKEGTLMTQFVNENIYEYDENGEQVSLAVARGDSVTDLQIEQYGIKKSQLGAAANDYDKARMLEIAEDNARISAEERAKDMAAVGMKPSDAEDLDVPSHATVRRSEAESLPDSKAIPGPREVERNQDKDNPAVEAGLVDPNASKGAAPGAPGQPSQGAKNPKAKKG